MRLFLMAALAAAGLALAATSGVQAAPIAPIGKGAEAIDSRLGSLLRLSPPLRLLSPPSSPSSLLVAPRSPQLPLVVRSG